MNVMMESWRSVPPNWALRWGITPTIAVLTATARDGGCAPQGTPLPKGSVMVMAEAIDNGSEAQSDKPFVQLRGVLRAMGSVMSELDIVPAQIAVNAMGRYWLGDKHNVPHWIKLDKMFRREGLPLTLTNDAPTAMRSLHVLNNPSATPAAPRLFVSPHCERLLKVVRDELRETQPLTDPMRALCYSIAIAPPVPVNGPAS